MIFLQILIGLFGAVGFGYILSDLLKIPTMKASRAAVRLGKKGDKKVSALDIYLKSLTVKLSEHLKLNEYKKAQLEADLRTAGMDMTPELYTANAIDRNSLGDVDGNGTITILDALMALQATIDRANLTADQFLRADIDGNGEIASAEVLRILQYVSGKLTSILE